MKQLSVQKINDMVQRTVNIGGSRRTSGGSGAGGGGGVSSTWVDEHYVSKDFFARLFTINGQQTEGGVTSDVVVEPNDLETTITNIQAMVGFWTENYLSARGLNPDGGGGSGAGSLYLMTDVKPNSDASPARVYGLVGNSSDNGKVLTYSTTYGKWIAADPSGGGGSVTSISLTMPTGFSVSGSPITSYGTLAVSFGGTVTKNYVLAAPSAANGTPSWRALVAADIPDLSSTYASAGSVTTLQGYFDASGNAKAALKLTTVSKKAWGQTYWTANGVPDSISGDMSSVGDISASAHGTKDIKFFRSLEMYGAAAAGNGGYIDFHYNNSSSDYTSRIIEDASGLLKINNTIWAKLSAEVGVGTNDPYTKLDVSGGVKTTKLYLYKPNKANDTNAVYLEFDSTNSGIHLVGAGFYSDSYVSAHGANTSSGSGDFIPLSGSSSITGSLIPATNNACNLGSSTKAWGTIYCNAIAGNASLSAQNVSCTTLSTSARAVISSGAKFASICVESGSDGSISSSHVGEINRYSAALHLQYDTGTGSVTMCRQGFLFSTSTDGGGNNLSVISTSNRSLRIELGSSTLDPYISKPWNEGSDIRLKNIVKLIDEDFCNVQDIANAPIFDFTYKDDKSKAMHLGTSANYWQRVLPSSVKTMGDGFLAMNYGHVGLAAAVLTARKVVNHEERIKALEKENKQLKAEIERLKVS